MTATLSPAAPARLLLVRHGQTPGNVAGTFRGADGHRDPLNAAGERQAAALARALVEPRLPGVRLYASRYRRAAQTGEAIARALGVPLHTLEGVQEIATGDWAGRPYGDVAERADEMRAPDGRYGFPGGESLYAVAERCLRALDGVRPGAGETVIVVSHGAALVALLARLLGRDPEDAWRSGSYGHPNTGTTELLWPEDGPPTLLRLADVEHLNGPDED